MGLPIQIAEMTLRRAEAADAPTLRALWNTDAERGFRTVDHRSDAELAEVVRIRKRGRLLHNLGATILIVEEAEVPLAILAMAQNRKTIHLGVTAAEGVEPARLVPAIDAALALAAREIRANRVEAAADAADDRTLSLFAAAGLQEWRRHWTTDRLGSGLEVSLGKRL
ncbi:hypothetical protein [Jannaschia aquimarina]|uniref:N-acetyltransferase domain-containing protein n=1 Tax=Jannaschia aquimarina TaxID=935700 RepID=A0A0D1CT78_9RHOB|nr:hypothetical protein [Jannaschia aquimarina]KIT17972.1 hypothetical protein jaqu_02600 [Jannaschia aquimarina]SNT04694.1 hypothetical protein SAMN05421775_10512 [Jannaschia aquimarina]